MAGFSLKSLPNALTWLRLLAIPLLVGLYLPEILWPGHWPAWTTPASRDLIATVLFVLAALTDWFDGWLARRLGVTTPFGAFLDPVADKLIVAAALIVLTALGRVDALVSIIIIGREITISALREWMASIGARASVAVHQIGKLKTVAQLAAISMLLYREPLHGIDVALVGTVLIWIAAVLTVWSMVYYLRRAWPFFDESARR